MSIYAVVTGGGGVVKDGAPAEVKPAQATPAPGPEPLSRYGNGPVYEVLGKQYKVLESSAGYRQRGVASWYGTKFHGRLTSNREVYDMHAMTAAPPDLILLGALALYQALGVVVFDAAGALVAGVI